MLPDGSVFVVGGVDADGRLIAVAERGTLGIALVVGGCSRGGAEGFRKLQSSPMERVVSPVAREL